MRYRAPHIFLARTNERKTQVLRWVGAHLKIRAMKATDNYCIEYEKLFSENVRKQVEIAKCFMENMNLKSKLEKM